MGRNKRWLSVCLAAGFGSAAALGLSAQEVGLQSTPTAGASEQSYSVHFRITCQTATDVAAQGDQRKSLELFNSLLGSDDPSWPRSSAGDSLRISRDIDVANKMAAAGLVNEAVRTLEATRILAEVNKDPQTSIVIRTLKRIRPQDSDAGWKARSRSSANDAVLPPAPFPESLVSKVETVSVEPSTTPLRKSLDSGTTTPFIKADECKLCQTGTAHLHRQQYESPKVTAARKSSVVQAAVGSGSVSTRPSLQSTREHTTKRRLFERLGNKLSRALSQPKAKSQSAKPSNLLGYLEPNASQSESTSRVQPNRRVATERPAANPALPNHPAPNLTGHPVVNNAPAELPPWQQPSLNATVQQSKTNHSVQQATHDTATTTGPSLFSKSSFYSSDQPKPVTVVAESPQVQTSPPTTGDTSEWVPQSQSQVEEENQLPTEQSNNELPSFELPTTDGSVGDDPEGPSLGSETPVKQLEASALEAGVDTANSAGPNEIVQSAGQLPLESTVEGPVLGADKSASSLADNGDTVVDSSQTWTDGAKALATSRVAIAGAVAKPGIFEVTGTSTTLAELLELAGGSLPGAQKLSIVRTVTIPPARPDIPPQRAFHYQAVDPNKDLTAHTVEPHDVVLVGGQSQCMYVAVLPYGVLQVPCTSRTHVTVTDIVNTLKKHWPELTDRHLGLLKMGSRGVPMQVANRKQYETYLNSPIASGDVLVVEATDLNDEMLIKAAQEVVELVGAQLTKVKQ